MMQNHNFFFKKEKNRILNKNFTNEKKDVPNALILMEQVKKIGKSDDFLVFFVMTLSFVLKFTNHLHVHIFETFDDLQILFTNISNKIVIVTIAY